MTPPPPARRRGRPAAKASIDQRERLLDAAISLFAARGIAATPLNAIAKMARVTPALLHYYFGNRAKLVEAVVEERLMPVVGPVMAAARTIDDADPRSSLTRLAKNFIGAIAAAPWLPPLWVREILCEGGLLREQLLTRIAPDVANRIRTLVQRGQESGQINPDLDPRLVMISLIGLTVFALAAEPIWRRLPDSADIDMDALTEHVVALLQHGLEPLHAS
ncbi:MAG TPA: TetR/AcrR family transcriptional regulator [Gammaproteobacteria bacterium]|nr:TetR/AcrR family transcriptional regulator [Gammaproteobacteria bacterium]